MCKCANCGKQFVGGIRINSALLWNEYQKGKQTYNQLSKKYGYSIRTIQRKLDLHKIQNPPVTGKKVVVLMDTIYWGHSFGVILLRTPGQRQIC